MKNLFIIIIAFLIPIIGLAQDDVCKSFDAFEIVTKTDYLEITVSFKEDDSLRKNYSYPAFILYNQEGEIVAKTTQEYLTYMLIDNIPYKMKIIKDIQKQFSGTIELYTGALGEDFDNKVCSHPVSFGQEETKASVESTDSHTENIVYLEYRETDKQGAGRLKKVNENEWYEYPNDTSPIIGIYKETHRDSQYIYLISNDAIFQFDLKRNKIMKNGIDLLDVTGVSVLDIKIKSSLPKH